MNSGWGYRIAAVVGTVALTAGVVAMVNNEVVLSVAATLPILGRLASPPPHGSELAFEVLTATVAFAAAMVPLYKPRPRRILDTITLAQRRVILAMIALAAIGYFDYTYRLPRITVLLATPVLLVALPSWFVWIRRRPSGETARAIVVGDDPEQIAAVVGEVDVPLFGYLCPTRVPAVEEEQAVPAAVADGGRTLGRLGGLSRIEDVLVTYDIDTVFLAFKSADRAEFFGAVDACYEHGVAAKVHREQADSVLTAEGEMGTFVDVDIEPWDVQDYLVKRVFDFAFAVVGLVGLAPVMLVIVAAIKLDDGGSILYRQERTAVFGDTFDVYKFRTMIVEGETPEPINDDQNYRITRIGDWLRRTHLDEIPQLWSILVGDMSVVGPRAVWTHEESLIEEESDMWRKRWFVKPGLTGLAQIHDAKSTDPQKKLRLDLEYVRRQSFWFDVKIVMRQVWKVVVDVIDTIS